MGVGRWLWSILVALDQLAHVVLAPVVFYRVADADETWSSHCGKIMRLHEGIIPRWYPVARCIGKVVEWIQPGHFAMSIEEDRGKEV